MSEKCSEKKEATFYGINVDEKVKSVPGFGIFCVLLSCVFGSFSNLMINFIELHPFQILAIRFCVQFILYILAFLFLAIGFDAIRVLDGRTKMLVMTRGLLAFFCISLVYTTIRLHGNHFGNAITILTLLPAVFTPFIACLLCIEKCTLLNFIAVIFAIPGVFLIASPTFIFGGKIYTAEMRFNALAISLTTAAALSFDYIVVTRLSQVPFRFVNAFFMGITAIGAFVTLLIIDEFRKFETNLEIWILIFHVITAILAEYFYSVAMNLESYLVVEVMRSLQVVIAFLFQISILQNKVDWQSYLGSILILCAFIVNFCNKNVTIKAE